MTRGKRGNWFVRKCEICGKSFEIPELVLNRGRGKVCSKACNVVRSRSPSAPKFRSSVIILEGQQLWKHPCYDELTELLFCPFCEDGVYPTTRKLYNHALEVHRKKKLELLEHVKADRGQAPVQPCETPTF